MRCLITLCFTFPLLAANAQELIQTNTPPTFPVGEDAFIEWHKLPYQRLGVRAFMPSTYDRRGNNLGADGGQFLYQENDSFNVAMDVKGPGVFYFMRTNHFHGSPWHYEIDGRDLIVKETATDDPTRPKDSFENTTFIPNELFPFPLAWTWTTTHGADLMWRPIRFNQRMRIAYSRTYYGTGYYIIHKFPYTPETDEARQPLAPPRKEALEVMSNAGKDQTLTLNDKQEFSGTFNLKAFEKHRIADLTHGPAMVRGIQFAIPRSLDQPFGKCRFKVTWDHRWHESIDVPIDLFFSTGILHNPTDKEFLVKGLPITVRYDQEHVYLSCYWPMPFFDHARFELEEKSGADLEGIRWKIITVPYTDPVNQVAYFHATYTDHKTPKPGKDLTFLDTEQVEGGGEWSGHFVGMSWIFSEDGILWTLEGDPRIFLDDSQTPQGHGTGTEEWGGGGDYWGGRNMTIPLAGHPTGKVFREVAEETDKINSAYRFLVTDFFPFGKRAVVNLEHGGMNAFPEHYSGVAYWYGIDAPSLLLTDQLSVFNPEDRRRHQYQSPTDEAPYALVSRYNRGPDHDHPGHGHVPAAEKEVYSARMYYPAERDTVINMTGTAQFRVQLHPENHGLLIRRKFDYQYPNQEARVFVKKAGTDTWQFAGTWYHAGSNTIVFSRPGGRAFSPDELAPTEHNIITNNRRWQDDEFLVAAQLTRGIGELEIKMEFVANDQQLFPGQPFPEASKWSASRYWIYNYVMPYLNTDLKEGGDSRKYRKSFEELYLRR